MRTSTKEKDIIWARIRKGALLGQFEVKHILFHAENEMPDKEGRRMLQKQDKN